jgi:hypothetical protein
MNGSPNTTVIAAAIPILPQAITETAALFRERPNSISSRAEKNGNAGMRKSIKQ